MKNELPPEAMTYYISHPVEFIEQQVYGIKRDFGEFRTLTKPEVREDRINFRLEWQSKEILNALALHDYVSVHSGRGISKTCSLAWAALWYLYTRENAKVIATGPKFDQLKATLWSEILKWLQRSYIKDQVKWTAEKIYHEFSPGTWFGRILTSTDKENIAGIHGDHVLWLIDEASNVDEDIIDTIIGGMTDLENKIILTGNPTKVTGAFYRSFTSEKADWFCLQYSSEDSARKNKKWFSRMQRFPRESDMYRVNVLGLPPQGNPRSVIQLSDCEAAKDRQMRLPEPYLEMGVDPAAEGNDLTAIALRHGLKLVEIRTFQKTKAPEVVIHVLKMLRDYRKKTKLKCKCRIKIDDHGYGQAIRHYLALNETDNIEVIPVLSGSIKDDLYSDNITKMWFELANMIEKISLPNDDELIEELCARQWEPVGQSKQRVETKAKFKETIGRSPDRADACILCFAGGPKKIFSRTTDSEPNVQGFQVDWDMDYLLDPGFDGVLMGEVFHYGALVLNKDLSLTGIGAIYEYYANKLWVYTEFFQDFPIAEVISKEVRQNMRIGYYQDGRNAKIIANNLIFQKKENARPLCDMLRRDKLRVTEPKFYDEYGAIALGEQLFKNDKIIIHRNCLKTREQFNLWSIKDGRPQDNYGNCDALLLILSEVKAQMKQKPQIMKISDYKPVYKSKKEKGDFEWMKR